MFFRFRAPFKVCKFALLALPRSVFFSLQGAWLQRRDSERRLEADQGQGLIGLSEFGPKRAPEDGPEEDDEDRTQHCGTSFVVLSAMWSIS